jgi:hypothetical protein
LKVDIFVNEIKSLIEILNKCKKANSQYEDKQFFSKTELKNLDIAVDNSLEISSGLVSGVSVGVLAGIGASAEGLAIGTAVLSSSLILAPILAVGGLFLDNKAEENLTEARIVKKESEKAIEQMKTVQVGLDAIITRSSELSNIIIETKNRFNKIKDELSIDYCHDDNFQTFLSLGKVLKNLLDISILDDDGKANQQVSVRIQETLKLGE